MARTKLPRIRIYRETVDQLIGKSGMKKVEFCEAMGHTSGWLGAMFPKGYYDITKANLRVWALVLGCKEEDLTQIPVSNRIYTESKEAVTAWPITPDLTELQEMLVDGFRMLHQDIQILTETMHKYWKPEEPKYEIKDREQP